MARFYQQVKTLMSDIDKFLVNNIKDSKLSKAALAQKNSILDQIAELKNDYPQLQSADETPTPKPKEQAPQPEPQDTGDDLYEDTETTMAAVQALEQEDTSKKEVPATDTTNLICSGLLKPRKDKKGNILSKLTKKQSYCVLRGQIFYIYEKKTSKKQMEAFSIEGYNVTSLLDEAKKDFAFELACEDKKNYIFEAASQEELQLWLDNLDDEPEAFYSEGDNNNEKIPDDDPEDLYEDTEAFQAAPRSTIPSDRSSPPPVPASARGAPPGGFGGRPPPALPARNVPTVPEPEDGEELYDETQPAPQAAPTLPNRPAAAPPTADEDQDIYDETLDVSSQPPQGSKDDEPQDIYDETEAPAPVRSPTMNKSSLFSPSLQAQSQKLDGGSPQSSFRLKSRPTPPPPKQTQTPPTSTSNGSSTEPDYENMFYGVWDCKADQEKELSFTRGDIITVVDRKHEDKGWWVGWLHDKVGLVPRNFLAPAYERV